MTSKSKHFIRATAIGLFVEGGFFIFLFETTTRFTGAHAWMEYSQIPGAQIATAALRFSGRPSALLATFLIQTIIFILVSLGFMYILRRDKQA